MKRPTSLFATLLCKQRPLWLILLISLVFLSMPFLAAWLDGNLQEIWLTGRLRILLIQPLIILYIWWVSPAMARMGDEVVRVFRQLSRIEEQDYDAVIDRASYIPSWQEFLVILGGVIFGYLISLTTDFSPDAVWLRYYWFVANVFLYALLAWTVFASVANTRSNAALHGLPLHFDILDPSPFGIIGRQSLLLALVFIGGITISFLLSFQPENLVVVQFWIFYMVMIGITVLIFILNMRPTHQILAETKRKELRTIQAEIRLVVRLVLEDPNGQDASIYQKLNALAFCEERLQAARTWPYNTAILRTLFFSVLIPVGTLVARLVVELVSNRP
jgi:hypothetical protein